MGDDQPSPGISVFQRMLSVAVQWSGRLVSGDMPCPFLPRKLDQLSARETAVHQSEMVRVTVKQIERGISGTRRKKFVRGRAVAGLSDILNVAVRSEDSTLTELVVMRVTDEKGPGRFARNSGMHKMDFCRGIAILPMKMSVLACDGCSNLMGSQFVKQFPVGSSRQFTIRF